MSRVPGYDILTFDDILAGACGPELAVQAAAQKPAVDAGLQGPYGPSLQRHHDLVLSRDPSLPCDMRIFHQATTRQRVLAYESGARPAGDVIEGAAAAGPVPRRNLEWRGSQASKLDRERERVGHSRGPGRKASTYKTQIADFLPDPLSIKYV